MKRLPLSFLFVLLVSVALPAQKVCFNEVDTFTGPNPWSAVVFDSNHDGKLDMALHRGFGANNVNSLLGNGGGTFTKLKSYHGPGQPNSVAAGDFNGDGKQDLAIAFLAPTYTGTVGILLGNGDGTFGNAHEVNTAQPANAIVVGDFNGDGKLDVAITTGQYATAGADIELLLGNGDGTLQAPTVITSLPWYTTALSVTDLNADGKLDLVSDGGLTGNARLTVLLGNGNGTFQTPQSYTNASLSVAQTIAIADVNGDGNLDVAVPGGQAIDIFFGNGNGTLTGPASVPLHVPSLSWPSTFSEMACRTWWAPTDPGVPVSASLSTMETEPSPLKPMRS